MRFTIVTANSARLFERHKWRLNRPTVHREIRLVLSGPLAGNVDLEFATEEGFPEHPCVRAGIRFEPL